MSKRILLTNLGNVRISNKFPKDLPIGGRQPWVKLTELCDYFGFPYHSIKGNTFPFIHDEIKFERFIDNRFDKVTGLKIPKND